MKKHLPLFLFLFLFSGFAYSQGCGELFISEYVEGYGNNRALEIYNPTPNEIDISQYSEGRFSNGSTEFTGIPIPEGNVIGPYESFVIVIDKRDSLGTGLETPVWNGYQSYDVCIDQVSGLPIIDSLTMDTIYCVQYDDNGQPIFGTVYNEFLDLEGKGDVFLCPIYNVNNAMYFNGNDAVALIKGREFDPSNPMILDVIGVIGEDPQSTINQPAWVDDSGFWVTRDRSLIRNPEIKEGTGLVSAFDTVNNTFDYTQWDSRRKNDFGDLGGHACECNVLSNDELSQVDFSMYPNPIGDNSLNISGEFQIENVRVYNIHGQLIFKTANQLNSNFMNLRLPEISKGVYTVLVDFGNEGTGIQKLIK